MKINTVNTRRFYTHIRFVLALLLLAVLLACGAPAEDDNTYAGGGIGGTGVVSSGTVTDIGSIWVNGVEYDTSEAALFINGTSAGIGDPAIFNHIFPGQVVLVAGSIYEDQTGTAEEVYYITNVAGPVASVETIDAYDRRLTVLNQDVVVTEDTVVETNGLGDIMTGDLIEVSGLRDDTGRIIATFVSKTAAAATPQDTYWVSGVVGLLDENQHRFFINALEIDYSTATLSGNLADGLANQVRILASGYRGASDAVFMADTLQPFNPMLTSETVKIEIEGIAGTKFDTDRFAMEGFEVLVDDDTRFSGGVAADIYAGTHLEVEGALTGSQVTAESIVIKDGFKLETELKEKNAVTQILVMRGFESMTVRVNSLTRYIGVDKTFDDLAIGNRLSIRGRITSDQSLLATLIVSTPVGNGKVTVVGAVSDITPPLLTLQTVTIDMDAIGTEGFFEADEVPISREDFISQIQQGNAVSVEARGQLGNDDNVTWNTLTLYTAE